MKKILLIALITICNVTHGMDFDFDFGGNTPDYSAYDIDFSSPWAFVGNYDIYQPTYHHEPSYKKTEHEEFKELNELSKRFKHVDGWHDCLGTINQTILETTNTHTWAARAIVGEPTTSQLKPRNDSFYYVNGYKHYDLLPDQAIVSAWSPDNNAEHKNSCAMLVQKYNTDDSNYTNTQKIYIPYNPLDLDNNNLPAQGISTNLTNPQQCAIRFSSSIRLVDINTQQQIRLLPLEHNRNYSYRDGSYESLYHELKKPIYRNNLIYVANSKGIILYDDRQPLAKAAMPLYSVYDEYRDISAVAEHNDTLFVVTSPLGGNPRTIHTLDKANHSLNLWWKENKRSKPGDVRYTHDYCSTNLIASNDYIIMCGVKTIIVFDRLTQKINSFYTSETSFNRFQSQAVMALDNNNNFIHYQPEKGILSSAKIKKLIPEEIGQHVKTLEAAALLQALHHEVKSDGGPVCNKGFNEFTINNDDFSPQLWAIIKAQGIEPYHYISDSEKQTLKENKEDNTGCSIQ